jgi:hypothetical protein
MRIIENDSIFNLEHKTKNEEFLSLVFSEIFLICSEDKELQGNKREELSSVIKELETRISKQNEILSKAEGLKDNIKSKSSSLDDENMILKEKLLEMLGSE